MRQLLHVLLWAGLGLQVGCTTPAAPKANWNFFSEWKVDTRAKKGPTTGQLATGQQPANSSAAICLATASELERDGHLREAAVLFEKARQLDPQIHAISAQLAGLYASLNDLPAARREFERALTLTPQNADLWNDLGYFEFRHRELAAAERAFRKALAINPHHARATLNLAQTLANAGRLAEAFDMFSQQQGPANAHASLGTILAGQGKLAEARGAFQQALAFNSQHPQALAFLANMQANTADRLP